MFNYIIALLKSYNTFWMDFSAAVIIHSIQEFLYNILINLMEICITFFQKCIPTRFLRTILPPVLSVVSQVARSVSIPPFTALRIGPAVQQKWCHSTYAGCWLTLSTSLMTHNWRSQTGTFPDLEGHTPGWA